MKLGWRQSILYITTVGTEGCWLYAVIALLNKQVTDGHLSILGLLLPYPVSFGFNWLLQRRRGPKIAWRIVSWLAWAVGMLLVVKIQLFSGLGWSEPAWLLAVPRAIGEVIYTFQPELLILLSSAALWWLGRRLAYLSINFATMVSEFQFGLVILAITFFVSSQLKVDSADSVPTALNFFLFGLLGMSIAHAQEGKSWLSGLYRGHWSGLLLMSIGLILLSGLLIGLLVTPDLMKLVLVALKWIWGLIMKAIAFVVSLFPEPEPVELPLPMPTPIAEPSEEFKLWEMPESVRNGLRIGWNVVMVGLVLTALWRISSQIFGWLRRKLASMAGAEFEPLPGAFKADLLGLLKHLLFRFFRLRLPARRRVKPELALPEIASVRQIYRQLLRWAASGGYPRHLSQTPHEYLYVLIDLLPEARGGLDLITQRYVAARYGMSIPTEDELEGLRQSWQKVAQNHLEPPGSKNASG